MGSVGHASVSTLVGGNVWAVTRSLRGWRFDIGSGCSNGCKSRFQLLPMVHPEKTRQTLRVLANLGVFHNRTGNSGFGLLPNAFCWFGSCSPKPCN